MSADGPFDRAETGTALEALCDRVLLDDGKRRSMRRACGSVLELLDRTSGATLQERWASVEADCWREWEAGRGRLAPAKQWTWGPAGLVLSRQVRPGWELLSRARLSQWLGWLPEDDPLNVQLRWLAQRVGQIAWAGPEVRRSGHLLGVRIMLREGYATAREITEADLRGVPDRVCRGMDTLDAVLCAEGVLGRTPQRGSQRRLRTGRLTPAELVDGSAIPERFAEVHRLYLETYQQRVSDVYATTRHKHNSLEKLWAFLDAEHPDVESSAQVRRSHLLAFVPHAIQRAGEVQRRQPGLQAGEVRLTAHQWLINVRCFFADICTWALEDGSPFAVWAPPAVPLERHDLVGVGFEKARRRQGKRQAAAIFDLEREVPKLRALATRRWQDATSALDAAPDDPRVRHVEMDRFWDWALLELLLQSGLRIEEACELTTLDIVKRRHSDGRVYYLLHVKPSKFDRARVLPIGDGLGRVISQIIRHVKVFYAANEVPCCDGWDSREKTAGPHAPYLLQGAGHPSQIAYGKIRSRLARLSKDAGATRSDGTPLLLRPHDCRRVFASEHLNNNTPIHVIQALLGHASPDTVMVYAKLYPATLVEEYRKTVRATYLQFHGPGSDRAPDVAEWQAFSESLELRDMGTHLCALPAGEHCSRGLVCLGCTSAQPKKSAVPVFQRMLTSHTAGLDRARGREPAGQIAARELEVQRITSALRRAGALADDVAAAIEAA
ncbi:MAG: tyrosine-type recombinase/integrase [Vicinamibacterales bacterium]